MGLFEKFRRSEVEENEQVEIKNQILLLPEDFDDCFLEKTKIESLEDSWKEEENQDYFEDCEFRENEKKEELNFEDCEINRNDEIEDSESLEEKEKKEEKKFTSLEESLRVKEGENLEVDDLKDNVEKNIAILNESIKEKEQQIQSLDELISANKTMMKNMIGEMGKEKFGSEAYITQLNKFNELKDTNNELMNDRFELVFTQSQEREKLSRIEKYSQFLEGVEMVDPNDIKGYVSTDEKFWEHHNNTEESYMELVSKLPEVKKCLAEGADLESLYENDELRDTAWAYFSEEKMIRVSREEGTLQFSDDGRHRIEIAKRTGQKIPVKIV